MPGYGKVSGLDKVGCRAGNIWVHFGKPGVFYGRKEQFFWEIHLNWGSNVSKRHNLSFTVIRWR